MFYKIRECLAKSYARHVKEKAKLDKIKYGSAGKPKWTTSKKILTFVTLNCLAIEIYAMIMTPILSDSSMMIAIISPVFAEVLALLGYFAKSTIENKEGGITYETAQHEWNKEDAVG